MRERQQREATVAAAVKMAQWKQAGAYTLPFFCLI